MISIGLHYRHAPGMRGASRGRGWQGVRVALLVALGGCPGGDDGPTDGTPGTGARPTAVDPQAAADIFARAAVVLGSCVPDDGVNRNLANLWQTAEIPQLWGRFALQAECLANAGGGCDAVTECLGYRFEVPASCTQGCRGSVFTYCDVGIAISLDCSALGLACDDRGSCVGGAFTSCDQATHVATCDADGLPLSCDDGSVQRGPDCAELGLQCEAGACRGTGAACTADPSLSEPRVAYSGIACAGDVLHACVGGAEHELDCAAIAPGFSCREAEGVRFCGLAGECVPGNHPDFDQPGTAVACTGSTLAFCNAGRIDRIDCRDLGFTGCDGSDRRAGCLPNFASELGAR